MSLIMLVMRLLIDDVIYATIWFCDFIRLCCEELLSSCVQFGKATTIGEFLQSLLRSTYDDLSLEDKRSQAILFLVAKLKDRRMVEEFFVSCLDVSQSCL